MKAISFLILALIANSSFAQSYIPLPVGNVRWLETEYSMFGPNFDKSYSIFSMDTASYPAFGHDYKKYELIKDSVYTISKLQDSIFIYDDTFNKKIYFNQNGLAERVFYDFSKSVGDTVKAYCKGFQLEVELKIDSIEIKNIHGINRRYFYLTQAISTISPTTIWIEGIGSSLGLFNNIFSCMPTDPVWGLNCVHHNNIQLYGTSCNFKTVGLNDLDISTIQLGANPIVSNTIELENPNNKEFNWSLFSPDGKLLKKGNECIISIPEFPSGNYFLKVVSTHNSKTFKVIK